MCVAPGATAFSRIPAPAHRGDGACARTQRASDRDFVLVLRPTCRANSTDAVFPPQDPQAAIAYLGSLGADAKLRLYHEVSVVPGKDVTFEYYRCHPPTGMLRAALPSKL